MITIGYSNGDATRKRILEVCNKLFYENGLVNTTYKDICREAGVLSGTLTHHFSSKQNIAVIVYLISMYDLDYEIDMLFPEEDKLQRLLLSIYLQLKVMYSDSCYCRFRIDFSNADLYHGSYMRHLPRILSEVLGSTPEPGTKLYESAMFRAVAFRGMQAALSYYIGQRLDELPFENAYWHWAELVLLLNGKRDDEINTRIDGVFALAKTIEVVWEQLNVYIKPLKDYFEHRDLAQ